MEVWDFIEVDSLGLSNRALQTLFKRASQWRRNPRGVKAKLLESACSGVGTSRCPQEKGRTQRPGEWKMSDLNFLSLLEVQFRLKLSGMRECFYSERFHDTCRISK